MRYQTSRCRPLGISLAVILSTGIASAQSQTQVPPPQNIKAAASGTCSAFHVTSGTLEDLVGLPKTNVHSFQVKVLLGTKLCQLRLAKHEVRAANFKLIAHDGTNGRVMPTPPCITYRGDVVGHTDSVIAASLIGGQLKALVQLSQGEAFWGIQPVTEVNQTAKASTHMVYHSSKSNAPAGTCGVTDEELDSASKPVKSYGPNAAGNKVCEIACDADNWLYRARNSNVTTTQNDVTSVVNGVAVIYKRDAAIDYKITTIIVRTSRVYTSTNLGTMLGQFRSRWNAYHTGIKRDTAHLFNGLTGGGVLGVAYLKTICNVTASYGASKTGFSNNFTNRVALTAHELGHSWSSPHCNNSNPCNIMCSGFGGCSRNITSFGPFAKSYLVNFRNTRNCLSADSTPVLSAISPNPVQAFPQSSVTLTGTGLTNVNRINVGNLVVQPAQITIVNDTKLTFLTPSPTSLLPTALTAEVSGQKSNSLPLYWNPTTPPKLVAYSIAKPGNSMLWQWGAAPGDLWFLTVGAASNTTPFLGYQWLNNPILMTSGRLDGAGLGLLGAFVPTNTMLGLKVYSQVVTLDPNRGVFAGNTNVTLTTTAK